MRKEFRTLASPAASLQHRQPKTIQTRASEHRCAIARCRGEDFEVYITDLQTSIIAGAETLEAEHGSTSSKFMLDR
jgi:hypothetical protein